MGWQCMIEGYELENVRMDRKKVTNIEKYGISEQAIYFDGKYLPVSVIRNVVVKPSFYFPNHCCGKGIPVFKLGIDYGGEKPVVLMMENEKNVEKVLYMLSESGGQVP